MSPAAPLEDLARLVALPSVHDGAHVEACSAAADLTFFLCFCPAKRFEEFTVDVAWSRDGKYPEGLPSYTKDDLLVPHAFRMRLPLFWCDPHAEEFHWRFEPKPSLEDLRLGVGRFDPGARPDPEVVRRKAEELAGDAVAKIVEYAVPHFGEVAARQGVVFPPEV